MPQLDRLAPVIDNFATTALMVIQDILRIFIVRVASEKIECAEVLLQPIFIWLNDKVDETTLSEGEVFKVHQLLKFIASEHPNGKVLLWKMGVARVLKKLLQNCSNASYLENKMISERGAYKSDQLMLKWRIPSFRCLASIFSAQPSGKEQTAIEESSENAGVEECSSIMHSCITSWSYASWTGNVRLCSIAFNEVASSYIRRSAVPLIFSQIQTLNQKMMRRKLSDTYHDSSNMDNWCCFTPLLKCFKRLLKYVDANRPTDYCVETVYSFILGTIALSQYGDRLTEDPLQLYPPGRILHMVALPAARAQHK